MSIIILYRLYLTIIVIYFHLFVKFCKMTVMENRDYIKSLIATKRMTLKTLAVKLSEEMGKKYSYDSFRGKLARDTITYTEMKKILEILGYKIKIVRED